MAPRRSRQDKLQAIVKHYLPNVPVPVPVRPPAPSQFQSEFYEELILCRGPFCASHEAHLRPRLQVIGVAFQMKGGGALIENGDIRSKFSEVLESVGLKPTGKFMETGQSPSPPPVATGLGGLSRQPSVG